MKRTPSPLTRQRATSTCPSPVPVAGHRYMLPSMIHSETNSFAHTQSRGESGESSSFCPVGLNGIVQHARFSEATLILTIVTRRAIEPAPPITLIYASGDGSTLER